MQKNSEKKSEASREAAAFHLQKLYEVIDYCPWSAVWEKLTATQRRGVCLVAGVSIDNGEYHERWANFTLADCQKIQRAVSTFCSVSEKVRRAVGAANAVRGEVAV